MAITLLSPLHSFYNLSYLPALQTECVPEIPLCLPVYALTDLKFQILAYVSESDKALFNATVDGTFMSVLPGICTDCNPVNAPVLSFSPTWVKITTGVGAASDVWIGTFKANNVPWGIDVGECFRICFYKYTNNGAVQLTTYITCTAHCFVRISDPCFTSLFNYRCNEDSFAFYYEDTDGAGGKYYNSIRLPCYMRNMQLPSEEKTYRKSDGTYIKLFERIDEEYELIVDYMPKEWHQKLKVLLAHDEITISNPNETSTGGNPLALSIVCTEKYELNWPDYRYKHAQGKTVVRRSQALHLTNSNCS